MELILALKVPTRPTADSAGDSSPDPPDGERESLVGRGTHCQRAAREAGYSGITANGEQVPAATFAATAARRYALGDVSSGARGLIELLRMTGVISKGENDLSAALWLERHAPGFSALSAGERSALMHFTLLWSLFEGEVLNAAANVNTIGEVVQRWNRVGALTAGTFSVEVEYFKERYYADDRFNYWFEHLHLERSGNPQVVRDVLSGHDVAPASVATAVLIIVFRYRNNLFHGEKWAYELREQEQNFSHANAVLMRAIDLNRQVGQAMGS